MADTYFMQGKTSSNLIINWQSNIADWDGNDAPVSVSDVVLVESNVASGGGGGGSPGGSNTSIQYNNSGSFGGTTNLTYKTSSGGYGNQVKLKASNNTDLANGFVVNDKDSNIALSLTFADNPTPSDRLCSIYGIGVLQVQGADEIQMKGTSVSIDANNYQYYWPTSPGTVGQSLTYGTSGQLEFTTIDPSSMDGYTMPDGYYTLRLVDKGRSVDTTSSSAVVITVPQSILPTGSIVYIYQKGSGQITVQAGVGVTLRSSTTYKSYGQYAMLMLWQESSNVWVLTGDRSS